MILLDFGDGASYAPRVAGGVFHHAVRELLVTTTPMPGRSPANGGGLGDGRPARPMGQGIARPGRLRPDSGGDEAGRSRGHTGPPWSFNSDRRRDGAGQASRGSDLGHSRRGNDP